MKSRFPFYKFFYSIIQLNCVGILEQSMGAKNRVGIGLSTGPRKATKAGGINSLESIPGLLKSFKIPSLISHLSFW